MIRLVLFDAYATLIKPRRPISEQYLDIFSPHFMVRPRDIKPSFKLAMKELQEEMPLYSHPEGVNGWWEEIIRRTAVGAGGDPHAVQEALPEIVPQLMKRFSSREGYEVYADVIPALRKLSSMGMPMGVVSNADFRMHNILQDLGLLKMLHPCILSEVEGVEKPSQEIWERAMTQTGMKDLLVSQVLHIGDELECDYHGARRAGLNALLLRRPGSLGHEERKDENECLPEVETVQSLAQVVSWVTGHRKEGLSFT